MWKFFARGVRESLERGVNISRSERIRKEKQIKKSCPFTPAVCQTNYINFKSKCNNNRFSDNEERRQHASRFDSAETWLGALSLSSTLVLGWVLTQPYRWRRWWGNSGCHVTALAPSRSYNLVELLGKVVIAQPVNSALLPIEHGSSSSVLLCNNGDQPRIQFGPPTAEQALEEAAERFQTVHNSLIGEVENRKGVACISQKKNREAIELFRSAVDRKYAPAAFNLAQCYERGIGTKQNFVEAAKLYRMAADLGHPSAMYNLGVFYAHGWGGLEASRDLAREWLKAAADRGQPDARAALGLPPNKSRSSTPPPPPPIPSDFAKETDYESDDDTVECVGSSNDPDALYRLARSFESPSKEEADPYLILQMYKFAADLGHSAANARLQVLQAYDALGLLSVYLKGMNSSEQDCIYDRVIPQEAVSAPI